MVFRPKGWVPPSPRSHFTEGNIGSNLAHWILVMIKPLLPVCTWLPDSTYFLRNKNDLNVRMVGKKNGEEKKTASTFPF